MSNDSDTGRTEVRVLDPGPPRTMTPEQFEALLNDTPDTTFHYQVRKWDGDLVTAWSDRRVELK